MGLSFLWIRTINYIQLFYYISYFDNVGIFKQEKKCEVSIGKILQIAENYQDIIPLNDDPTG